jgi:xanthine dehydrogenase accessory factor
MLFADLLRLLNRATPCVWVAVTRTQGSAPREEGAGMVVTQERVSGTIGGGHLELKAVELAREWLRLCKIEATQRHYPLGPALGQCCGGAVDLLFRPVTEAEREWVEALAAAERDGGEIGLATQIDQASPHTVLNGGASTNGLVTHHHFKPWHVWIFGAGHVGKALTQVFGTLPCAVTWVDSRDAEFPAVVPENVRIVQGDHPADEVADIPDGADVLVLTHSHALDLDIVMQLVRRDDLAYIGVIGSETKARLFRRRLEARGLDAHKMVCPIGMPAGVPAGAPQCSVKNKHPGAIALSVATDLLARREAFAHSTNQAAAHV